MPQYQITVRYLPPAGRKSEFTEEAHGKTYTDAKQLVIQLLGIEPRRKVESITGFTGIRLDE